MGEDLVTITKGFNTSFLVNIATIFESENFFLPGIQWNGILGLAYAALAKVSIVRGQRNRVMGGDSANPLAEGPVNGSRLSEMVRQDHRLNTPLVTRFMKIPGIFKIKGTWHNF